MQRLASLTFECPCGEALAAGFDLAARQHWRTMQCPGCRAVFEIMRPTVIQRPGCAVSVPKPDSEGSGR